MTECAKRPSLQDVGAEFLFEKILSASDTTKQGRVIIFKAHALQHLPPLDSEAVEVRVQDTCGTEHVLKYHAWLNSSSRMHLLEGMQPIMRLYGLRAGDGLVFGRLPSGQLVICGREGEGPPKLKAPKGAGAVEAPPTGLERAKRRKRGQQRPYDPSDFDQPPDAGWQPQAPLAQPVGLMPMLLPIFQPAFLQPPPPPQPPPPLPADPLQPLYEPQLDGVFREVPPGVSAVAQGVAAERGCWVASLALWGQTYQACFDSQESALQAHEAATGDSAGEAPALPPAG